jgi:VanZ family protein
VRGTHPTIFFIWNWNNWQRIAHNIFIISIQSVFLIILTPESDRSQSNIHKAKLLEFHSQGQRLKHTVNLSPRYRLHRYLAVCYALFIVYASLTPFSGWQEQGLYFSDVLTAPLYQTFTWFDFTINCLAYFPFGFLLAYMLRFRWPAPHALLGAMLTGFILSAVMEYTQIYLPSRVSSNSDLLSNSTGTFCGAAFALFIARYTWFERIKTWHNKWFKHGRMSDFGLALVFLWIFAQTNPSLPMLGSVFVSAVARWPFDIVPAAPFNMMESAEVALNFLLLGILLLTLMRERRYTMGALFLVLSTVTLIKFISAAVLLKSWALLLWLNSEAMLGILAGLLLLLVAMRLSRNWLLGFGTLAAILYLLLVQNMLFDSPPSTAKHLYHWHYLHLLNYNGLSQLVNFLFPILLLGYLWRTGKKR